MTLIQPKEIDNIFLFNDLEDQYIVPTYRIFGDGELVDSKGGKYRTTSNIFICAIDPEFLLEKTEVAVSGAVHLRSCRADSSGRLFGASTTPEICGLSSGLAIKFA